MYFFGRSTKQLPPINIYQKINICPEKAQKPHHQILSPTSSSKKPNIDSGELRLPFTIHDILLTQGLALLRHCRASRVFSGLLLLLRRRPRRITFLTLRTHTYTYVHTGSLKSTIKPLSSSVDIVARWWHVLNIDGPSSGGISLFYVER